MIRLCLKLLLVLIIHSSFAVDTQAQSIAEIAENVGKSVAMIVTYDVTGSSIAQGSGVFITKTGIILTNAHVVNDAYSAEVISSFGTFDKVRILAQDSKRDLALISIPTNNSFPVSVAGNTKFKPGDRGGPSCLDRMFHSLSGALRYSDYAAVSRVVRLSQYTCSGVWPSSARCGLCWL